MLKHPDPEVQFLVEILEGQRDQAVAQAAAHFRMVQELQGKVNELENQVAKSLGNQCNEGNH
jgi:hypothetical protein